MDSIMMEEYLRTMRQIIEEQCAERCQRLEERATLMCDKEETSLHLANIKDSFNDVHV